MAEKIAILKNNSGSQIILESLGIIISAGDQVDLNWEEILEAGVDSQLISAVNSGDIIVSDGSSDFNIADAIEYLQLTQDLDQYYTVSQVDSALANKADSGHAHPDLYYGKGEVDSLISGIEGYGIVGAVDDIDDLPQSYTGNVGDIYIVRISVGQGSGGPSAFTVDTDTGLYLPMEDSWEDALGHSGNDYSSMDPTNTPLTPPFGTKYCDFDGNNDWLKFYSSSDFGEGPYLTVGGWIYTREGGNQGIIARWDDSGNGWKLDIYGGKLRASLDTLSMSEVQFCDPNAISQNQWIHVAMVYDGSNVILYRNATEVNRVSGSGTTIDSYNMDIRVGRGMGHCGFDDYYFSGGMKDMFVQNSAMTQEQLQNLVSGNIESFADEGFYQWDGSEWNFLARNTGENGGGSGSSYHNSLLGLNSDDYQHLTQDQKDQLTQGNNTSLHKHDDRYYTESEVDSFLDDKSDDGHNHDSRYYTESEVNSLLNNLKYSDISSNDPNTNITSSELEQLTDGSNADGLHTHNFSSGVSDLDGAYEANATINVDQGSFTLNASNGYAPIRLNTISYVPNQNLTGGEICYYDGELFAYDGTRGKWLSVSGHYIGGGINSNNVKNSYIRGYNGTSFSDDVGWVAPWKGTIVTMSISSDDSGSSNVIRIKASGSNISGASLSYNGQKQNWDKTINADFNEGDVLNFYVDGSDNDTSRPQCWAIIKRRI